MPTAALPYGTLVCDGSAVSRVAYASLFAMLVTNQGFASQTCTISIASPAVITKSAHGFLGGERVRFSTTGALPTGMSTTVDYYVLYVNANTFQISLTPAGTPVNTSGSQSGTQSYLQSLYGLGDGSTTFNLPDYRGLFLRGKDGGRGLDHEGDKTLGSYQVDQIQGHQHYLPYNANINTNSGTLSRQDINGTNYSTGLLVGPPVSDGVNGTPRTAPETCVKNVTIQYAIVYI